MSEILFVNACMRGEESRTLKLCREYLADREAVVELDLSALQLSPFSGEMVAERSALQESRTWDDPVFALAHQFAGAEEIVIGAPYWDLSFPSAFKIFIEHVCVCDVTFRLADKGAYEGLCAAKHITYLSSCGGFISKENNRGYQYVCGIAEMFGIPEVRYVMAEGLDIIDQDSEVQLNKAREQLAKLR